METNYIICNDIYYIDIITLNKKILITTLNDICISPNYYSNTVQKKVIILINLHELKSIYQQSIKTIIDNSYLSCVFIIHTNNVNSIDRNIMSRFIIFSLPINLTMMKQYSLHIIRL